MSNDMYRMFGRSPYWPEPHQTRRVDPRLRAQTAMEQAASYIRELELANSRLEAKLAARAPASDPAELAARDRELAALRDQLSERNHDLAELRRELSEHKHDLAGLSERNHDLAELRRQLSERNHDLAELRDQLSERNHDLAELRRQLGGERNRNAELSQQRANDSEDDLATPEQELASEDAAAETDKLIRHYEIRLAEASQEIEAVKVRVRRDSARELEHKKRAFLCQFLEVLDDLDRAVTAARTDHQESAIIEGVELVRRHFLAKLEDHQVEHDPAMGERFDPNRHQALSTTAVDDPAADGLVAAVIREGYRIGDETLRPAAVVVNKLGTER